MKKEFLTEENYNRVKGKFTLAAKLVLIIGLLISFTLIGLGVNTIVKVNKEYSEETIEKRKESLSNRLKEETELLEKRKKELVDKGVKYDQVASYEDGEAYELYIIHQVLDSSFNRCAFDEYKNNSAAREYCGLKNELNKIENKNNDFDKEFESSKSIPFFMIGVFVLIGTCMISGSIYMSTKRRELLAYGAQSVMPVMTEGIEKVAPTITKVSKEMTEAMAPTYGKVAKEISKGIKEGINEANDKK